MKHTIAAATVALLPAFAANAQDIQQYPPIVPREDECVHRALVTNMQGVTDGLSTENVGNDIQSTLILAPENGDFFSINQTVTLSPSGIIKSIAVDVSRTLPENESDGVHFIENGRSSLIFDNGEGRLEEGTGAGISDTDVMAKQYVESLYGGIFDNCTVPSEEALLNTDKKTPWMAYTPVIKLG